MEYLAKVRDASKKEIGLGYWVDTVVGAQTDSLEIILLTSRLYSQDADGFVSENHELLTEMRRVYKATEGRGIFVIDRAGDRPRLYKSLLAEEALSRFIIR